MKIIKIFGLVVGIHVVAFMFVFAIPGCRSNTRHSPPPPAAVQAESAPVRMAAPSPVTDAPNPISSGAYASNYSSGSAQPAMAVADNSGSRGGTSGYDSGSSPVVRFNPTRPGSSGSNSSGGLNAPSAAGPESTPPSTQVVSNGDTLWKIARQHNLTIKELAAANNLRAEAPLHPGQKLIIPGKAVPSSTGSSAPTGPTGDTLVYTVKSGETLGAIARRAGTTPAAIRKLNHLKNDVIRAGQELTLPAGNTAATALAASSSAPADSEMAAPAARASSGGLHHTVRPGETLGQIARRYGVSRRDLAVANNIGDPLKMRAGQDLIIPNGKAPAAAAPRASSSSATAPESDATPARASDQNYSPIGAAPEEPSNPVASPVSGDSGPPVIQVQESNNPVAAPQ
jgi:LysM repeat protein